MRHPQPQWLVRITAESGSLTLALVWRPRHQPPVVIQLYSVYGLISNTMFAQSKEMNQAVDIYTALSTHRKVQISIRTMSTQLCSSSDPVPRGPPHPATSCRYLHTCSVQVRLATPHTTRPDTHFRRYFLDIQKSFYIPYRNFLDAKHLYW